MGEGDIASDWHQETDIWGAHVSLANLDRNFRGIGICLIGNFGVSSVSIKRYEASVSLTKKLMLKYSIRTSNVLEHGHTEAEYTKRPGKNFPTGKFLIDI